MAAPLALRVLHALALAPGAPAELRGVGPMGYLLLTRDGAPLLLIPERLRDGRSWQDAVREADAAHEAGNLRVLVTGGDPGEVRAFLSSLQPAREMTRLVQVFHAVEGDVWSGPRSRLPRKLRGPLDDAAHGRTDAPTREEIERRAGDSLLQARDQLLELQRHQRELGAREPRLTQVLVGLLLVMFALEWFWGGPTSVETLVRMGGLVPGTTREEPYRLLASALLHAGVVHLAFNALVLWHLGGFLERVLGSIRLVILFVLTALGGAVAGALTSDATVMVGASGGLWGFLGAGGALVFFPRGVIPDLLATRLRRATGEALVINLGVSFLPNVAMSAHLGGGLVGALLVVTGMLTAGLVGPRGRRPLPDSREDPVGRSLLLPAVALALGLLASAAVAILAGRPWELG